MVLFENGRTHLLLQEIQRQLYAEYATCLRGLGEDNRETWHTDAKGAQVGGRAVDLDPLLVDDQIVFLREETDIIAAVTWIEMFMNGVLDKVATALTGGDHVGLNRFHGDVADAMGTRNIEGQRVVRIADELTDGRPVEIVDALLHRGTGWRRWGMGGNI